jgi:hypothetical protein
VVVKRIALGLLIVVLISQLPFAYRRYRLGRLNATILQLNAQRVLPQSEPKYREYKGVLHVHSFLGGHSPGKFEEIIEAARQNELNFVVMTEHPAKDFNSAELTLNGLHGGVLFVNGSEVVTREGDRLLVLPGDELSGKSIDRSTQTVLEETGARRGLAVVAYPDDFKSWNTDRFAGIEIFNLFTNARQMNSVVMFFDGLWSLPRYHELLFANFYSRPSAALAKWDLVSSRRKVVALAGNDAHANIGFSLNDSAGRPRIGVRLDPYAISFRLVRVHVFLPANEPLEEKAILEAIAQGHCFIGFDLFCDSSGFSFTGSNGSNMAIQGDEISLQDEVRLIVETPIPARVVLFRNGERVNDEGPSSRSEIRMKERGTYRVEVYLPQLRYRVGQEPWIISNPIYVR